MHTHQCVCTHICKHMLSEHALNCVTIARVHIWMHMPLCRREAPRTGLFREEASYWTFRTTQGQGK